jgi:hypothetical protein
VYIARISQYQDVAPAADWYAIFTFLSK